jgi:hypothetical protein
VIVVTTITFHGDRRHDDHELWRGGDGGWAAILGTTAAAEAITTRRDRPGMRNADG